MKKYFNKIMILAGWGLLFFSSCSKNETKVYFKNDTAPVLTTTAVDSIPLNFADSNNTAVVFSWTNPNYEFSNGISSLNVTYYLQVDTAGANFSSPNMQTISISQDLSISYTVAGLNALLANGLLLATGQSHNIEARINSFVGASQLSLYSNTISFKAIPFAPPPAVKPPPDGTLFIVGAATAGGWDNPMTVDPATQQFTQVSPTLYTITINLNGGGEYKLIGTNGSWNDQWSVKDTDTYPNGGPFVFNGNNNIAPAASGTYTITVNFQTGKFTVTQ